MSAVVAVRRQGLTAGAKVGIMAHSALVSITHNARLAIFALAQRSIAVYAKVALRALNTIGDGLIKRDEAMPWMFVTSILDTSGAVIPVGAAHTFMAHAVDGLFAKLGTCVNVSRDVWYLITSIADCKMAHIAARTAEIGCHCIERYLFGGRLKIVAGVMAVL